MKIKLLVVDDSAFMRTAVRLMLKDDPKIEVVGEARDGLTAIQMVESLKPDVITMDVEMPGMDGVTATKIIMERFPRPIIMLSSLTERSSVTTVKALEAGAVDYISKKSSFVQLDIVQIGNDLQGKIRYWGEQHLLAAIRTRKPDFSGMVKGLQNWPDGYKTELVVIGVSTGGPAIMATLLRNMGELTCPVVIVQHMPLLFTGGFARHLKIETGLNVLEISDGMELLPGMVAVCPGGTDTLLREPLPGQIITMIKKDAAAGIHPSVDLLFTSAARLKRRTVAVIMTGMGVDGTAGAGLLAERGCPVLVQEPAECIVDGMPLSVIESGVASEVLNVEGIGRRLRKWAGAMSG